MERVPSIYIPERGVLVDLPPHVAQNVLCDPGSGEFYIGERERQRLKAILKDPILKARYPSYEDGDGYMDGVSPQWRDRLMGWAYEMVGVLKDASEEVGIDRFAVILHGSVAKNLVKQRVHYDPSNIDLAILGNISPDEGERIKNNIRWDRKRITAEIRGAESCRCSGLSCTCIPEVSLSQDPNPIERVGVLVQDLDKLRKNDHYQARMFMSSCAKVMYDPSNLWRSMEMEAAPSMAKFNLTKVERSKVMTNERRLQLADSRFLMPVGLG